MTTSTAILLPGVERYGAGFRVRTRFPRHLVPKGTHIETGIRTPELANARALELRAMRAAGVSPLAVASSGRTLAEGADALLKHKRISVSPPAGAGTAVEMRMPAPYR